MNDRVLRVIVADDHPVFRQGLRASLSAENDIDVVAECGDGQTVVATAITARPDVVLMDIRMPEMNGIEATGRILSAAPGTRILMLTMFDDDESVFEAMRAGARGYLLKGSEPADIARAVRSVAEGDAIFGPAIAERMMALFARRTARPFPALTEREHAVLNDRRRPKQPSNRQRVAAERQDSPKLRLDDLQQAPGCRSRRGHAQGAMPPAWGGIKPDRCRLALPCFRDHRPLHINHPDRPGYARAAGLDEFIHLGDWDKVLPAGCSATLGVCHRLPRRPLVGSSVDDMATDAATVAGAPLLAFLQAN